MYLVYNLHTCLVRVTVGDSGLVVVLMLRISRVCVLGSCFRTLAVMFVSDFSYLTALELQCISFQNSIQELRAASHL